MNALPCSMDRLHTQETAEWTGKNRAASPSRVWAYFNNEETGMALENARTLMRLLRSVKENWRAQDHSASVRR